MALASGGTGRDAEPTARPSAAAPSGTPRGLFARIDDWMAKPRSARNVILWLTLYLALAANWALWLELVRVGGEPGVYLRSIAVMALLLVTGTVGLLSLTAWSRWFKPLWIVLVVLAAVVQHYMLAYGMVMDPSMAANTTQTDLHEVLDLLSWRLLANVALVSVLPVWWLCRVRIVRMGLWTNAWRNAVLLLGCAAIAAGGIMAMNRQLAPLMRNNTHLRYMLNPLATVYSATIVLARPLFEHKRQLIPMTAGAALGSSYAKQGKPPLFVIMVGETARSDHFSLNGYARDTNPELARRDVLSYRNVHSCGTNTLASVPCMFSPLGKEAHEGSKDDYENLLDVLQAAGLAVLWVENQAGCKDVCKRVPNASAVDGLSPSAKAALCDADECLDDALLFDLDARLAGLSRERRARGVVLVMHMMGSHGPAYYKRSPPDGKVFVPECKTNALAECGHDELLNGYDNSIRYTDRVLARTVDWLKVQSKVYDTGMFYVSDHGESLGEFGLFLHGLPYSIAPEAQKHVPLVAWFSEGLRQRQRLSMSCMKGDLDSPYTHDNLYHTALAVMDVQTPTFKPALDMFGKCRAPAA
ncbi:phosphoethanolamine transferase [Variovorax humicola]